MSRSLYDSYETNIIVSRTKHCSNNFGNHNLICKYNFCKKTHKKVIKILFLYKKMAEPSITSSIEVLPEKF
jgi:hypothetical protein